MELQFAHYSGVLLTVDVEVYNIDVWCVNNLAQVCGEDCESESLRIAVSVFLLTIEVAGYITLFSQFFCGFFASVGTFLTGNIDFFHNCVTLNEVC